MNITIQDLRGLQFLDSRGRPTVCARILLNDGSVHKVTVPSGASTGAHEAYELRDSGSPHAETFYGGKSVYRAITNINEIIRPRLIGTVPDSQKTDDLLSEIDTTDRHEILGANATLAVSLVSAKATAHIQGLSLARFYQPGGALRIPMPMVNILSGGAHANGAIDIQDVLVIPHGATTFRQALSWIVAIRETAAKIGARQGFVTNLIADEGGLGIPFESSSAACTFVEQCIEAAGLAPGEEVSIALDIAASQFYDQGNYKSRSSGMTFTPDLWHKQLLTLLSSHPIISIEDPFGEDDWSSWERFMRELPRQIQVVGDDLFTTNLARLTQGISSKSANSILIKPNQNGLVTQTQNVLRHAQENGFSTIVSARSGETEDSWLADLATGWGAGQIKVGSTHGSERTAKWNRLLELEATEETIFSNPF
jgi:enolase